MDYFALVFIFYVLLSPFCLSSFLYPELYVLGDSSWISKRPFIQTKQLCVLNHTKTKGKAETLKLV